MEYVSEYNNSSLSYTFMIHFVTFRIGIFIYILEQAKVLGIRAITYQNIIIACVVYVYDSLCNISNRHIILNIFVINVE